MIFINTNRQNSFTNFITMNCQNMERIFATHFFCSFLSNQIGYYGKLLFQRVSNNAEKMKFS